MLFTSWIYFAFLPLIVVLNYVVPARYRWIVLLAASYFFYGWWRVIYLAIIAATTLVDYLAGLAITRWPDRKLLFLTMSIVSNLGVLGYFKYAMFIAFNLNAIAVAMHDPPLFAVYRILLPVGISFYTFQSLSYVIDVYRGRQKAERHLGYFALYVSFFPQLVAGPIDRARHLLPQLRSPRPLTWIDVRQAALLILWGLFKKLVVADHLYAFTGAVFDNDMARSAGVYFLASIALTVEIYCDFAGYTDIARGSARLFGVELPENFRQPLAATSIAELWARWHITLIGWMREYVYQPLTRLSRWRAWPSLAMILTFVVVGVWHGAAWGFLFRSVERFASGRRAPVPARPPQARPIDHCTRWADSRMADGQ